MARWNTNNSLNWKKIFNKQKKWKKPQPPNKTKQKMCEWWSIIDRWIDWSAVKIFFSSYRCVSGIGPTLSITHTHICTNDEFFDISINIKFSHNIHKCNVIHHLSIDDVVYARHKKFASLKQKSYPIHLISDIYNINVHNNHYCFITLLSSSIDWSINVP